MNRTQVISPGSEKIYVANRRIAETDNFTAYSCAQEGKDNDCYVLKIAKEPGFNALFDKEAFILNLLLEESKRQEEAFQEARPGTEVKMNYHLTFPGLAETFVSKEQNSRRILILDFSHVAASLADLTPLINVERKEKARIDQRTSAWILGKALKSLVFAHDAGILVNNLSRNNILVQKENHLVTVFDWSGATTTDDVASAESEDIAQLACAVIRALGGDLKTVSFPDDAESFPEYGELLKRFALGKGGSAKRVHEEFYGLVNKLWPREYYPFTTHPLR